MAVRVAARGRLVGVDAARCLALLGMMADHILPETGADGRVPALIALTSGRASALFALLAGVGLALSTGRRDPPSGTALAAARRGVLARAAVITAIGLTLGLDPGHIAVILVDYGLFFAAAALFLGWRARALAVAATGWLVCAPVLSHLLRSVLPPGPGEVPSWLSLVHPVRLLVELVLTGYYPALPWIGYLLAGMAVGRVGLEQRRLAAVLVAGGTAVAVSAVAVSDLLVRAAGGTAALEALLPEVSPLRFPGLDVRMLTTLFGTTPTTSWVWLAVHAPHSGTPFDLLTTTGSALAVLGVCLLVAGAGRVPSALLVPLAATGSMTLTLYTVHVLLVPPMLDALTPGTTWVVQVLAALALALLARAQRRRGPLEQLAAEASAAARGPTPPAPHPPPLS